MRDKGDGSVYQRGDGRWVGQVEDGYTKTGARAYRRRVRDTETDARRAVRARCCPPGPRASRTAKMRQPLPPMTGTMTRTPTKRLPRE